MEPLRKVRNKKPGPTSEKKSDRMMRLIQWMTLANWKALETAGGKEGRGALEDVLRTVPVGSKQAAAYTGAAWCR